MLDRLYVIFVKVSQKFVLILNNGKTFSRTRREFRTGRPNNLLLTWAPINLPTRYIALY